MTRCILVGVVEMWHVVHLHTPLSNIYSHSTPQKGKLFPGAGSEYLFNAFKALIEMTRCTTVVVVEMWHVGHLHTPRFNISSHSTPQIKKIFP